MFYWDAAPRILPNIAGGILSWAIFTLAWKARRQPRFGHILAILAAAGVWNLATAFSHLVPDVEPALWLVKLNYVSGVVATLSNLWLTCEQAGLTPWLSWRRRFALSFLPSVALLITFLGPEVPWIIARAHMEFRSEMYRLNVEQGPLYLLLVMSMMALSTVSLLTQLGQLVRSRRLQFRQNLILTAAILLPWTFYGIDQQRLIDYPIEWAPIGVTLSGAAYFLTFRYFSAFAILPVARDAAMEAMAEAAVITDRSGLVMDWNPAAQRLLGADAQWLGQPLAVLLAALPPQDHVLSQQRRPFHKFSEPLGDLWLFRDVTIEEQTRRALEEAKQNAESTARAKSDFLANMSHEIRTPLNGVIGLTELLRDTPLDASQRQYVALLQQSARSLTTLVNDILDWSKIEAGQMRLETVAFDPAALLQETVALFAPAALEQELALEVDVGEGLPRYVLGDPLRLKQILSNLLSNAIKFTPAGTVTARLRRLSGDDLEFVIADTGIGFDEATHARIFERFEQADTSTTRRFGGTGLGLAISRKLAHLMEGEITATSRPMAGSEFRVRLPLPAAAPAPEAAVESPAGLKLGARVLVAEDHPVNQLLATRLLERLGCQVRLASDGEEALAEFAPGRFDLILLDCHMPGRDGYAVAQEIRRREPSGHRVPILAVTASVLAEDRQRCQESGMDDFLPKPIDPAELTRLVTRWAPPVATR